VRYPFRPDEILASVADLVSPEPLESEMPEGI
jgi:NagD protein